MIKKRIHTLKAFIDSSVPQEPYEDDQGNIIFPDDKDAVPIEITRLCRAESNTVDGRTIVKDGVNYEYSYLIFTDKEIENLPINTEVEVTVNNNGEVFGKGEVVKFERGQRVTRIWLK